MTSISPGMARVIDTLQIASRFAQPADGPAEHIEAKFGPPARSGDYYERMLQIDMQENWGEVFEALRTIVQPMDIAKITQAELGKHIDYFEWDVARGYHEGKIFIGKNGDRVTSSPTEYMGWLKAKVTPETGPGVEVPFDQMRDALATLQTDEERQAFIDRNGLKLENAMVLFRADQEQGPSAPAFEPVLTVQRASPAAQSVRQGEFTDLSADEWQAMLQLIKSLKPAYWSGMRLSPSAVA